MRISTPQNGCLTAILVAALAATSIAGAESSSERPAVGAYCPLPEPGQKPVCLSPAEAQYADFFAAIETGQLGDSEAAGVEADLYLGGASERAYLALSSISYGYWRLATEVARAPDADPALMKRLRHWNEVLVAAYGDSRTDSLFRDALREAALDLQRHTPRHGTRCAPGEACEQADALVQTLSAFDANAGLRTPLERLIERFWSDSVDDETITRPVSDQR